MGPGMSHVPSILHMALQPSPSSPLPSSHSSPASSVPLPHLTHMLGAPVQVQPSSTWQLPSQPSPSFCAPSSQASPSSTTRLPHTALVGPSPPALLDEPVNFRSTLPPHPIARPSDESTS